MDEQKKARQALTIIQQSITEYMRDLKQKLKIAMLKKDLKTASGIEVALSRIEESPKKFEIVHIAEGDEQEFRDLLVEYGVENFYVNAPYMEQFNGSWLIPIDQWEELESKHLFKTVQETRQVMLDENEVSSPDQSTILHLKTTISLAEKEAAEYGDDDGREYLESLLADIIKCEPAAIVRPLSGKEAEFAHMLDSSGEPYTQIRSQYLPTYTGSYVVSETLYKQLASEGLIVAEEDINQNERDIGTGEETEETESPDKESQEQEDEIKDEPSVVAPPADKEDQKKENRKENQPESVKSEIDENTQESVENQQEQAEDHNYNLDLPIYETQEQENSQLLETTQQDILGQSDDEQAVHLNEIQEQNSSPDVQANTDLEIREQQSQNDVGTYSEQDNVHDSQQTHEEPEQDKIDYQTQANDYYATEQQEIPVQVAEYHDSQNSAEQVSNYDNPYIEKGSAGSEKEQPQKDINERPSENDAYTPSTETDDYRAEYVPDHASKNQFDLQDEQPSQEQQTDTSIRTDANFTSDTDHNYTPAGEIAPEHQEQYAPIKEDYAQKNDSQNINQQPHDNPTTTEYYATKQGPAATADKPRSSYEEIPSSSIPFSAKQEEIKEADRQPLPTYQNITEPFSAFHDNTDRKEQKIIDQNGQPETSFGNKEQKEFEKTDYAQRSQRNEAADVQSTLQQDIRPNRTNLSEANEQNHNLFDYKDQQPVYEPQRDVGKPKASQHSETENPHGTAQQDFFANRTGQTDSPGQDRNSFGHQDQSPVYGPQRDIGKPKASQRSETEKSSTNKWDNVLTPPNNTNDIGNKNTGSKLAESGLNSTRENQQNEKQGKNLTVSKDTLTKGIFVGHHDMFEKTAFKAAFSGTEETDLHRSTDVFRNEGFVNTLRAANTMAVSTLLTQDVAKMTSQLDQTQLGSLSKLISKSNCGTFNLEDPEKYQESMKALYNYMSRVGVLEKRSVSNGGALMYALDENGTIYEGNILDRHAAKKQDKLVQQKMKKDLKEKQKELKKAGSAGATAVSKTENISDTVAKKAKHAKKIVQKNKERTLEILKKDLGRAGLDESQANALLSFMYKNNKRFASTSRIINIADKGKSKILTLNPLKNSLTAKGIKEDANARYIYRVQSMAAGTQALYHAGTMIAKSVYDKQMASVARALNKVDTKLTKTGLDQAAKERLQKQSQILKQRQTTLKNKGAKWSARQKKVESGIKKVQDTLIKNPQDAIKKPFKRIGKGAKNVGGKIPGIQRVVNFKWATFTKNHTLISKIVSTPFTMYSNVMGWIAAKIIIPLLGILGHILIFMIVIAVGGGLIAACAMMVQSMFANEPGTNDPITAEEIMASTMGLVYNELQIEETSWANGLMHSADGETIHINDIKYSKVDEGAGTIDEQYHDVDAATYIHDVLGLEYDAATDTIITPEPWVGAPPEACHTADGNITGGVELRFVGLGGYPAYTSNIMEIISMASIASDDSTLVEYDDDTISEASDAGIIGKLGSFASGIVKGIKFAGSALSNFANKIISAIPGGQDFMNHNESRKRAKVFYSYSKPLFNLSHQTAYGLEFSFLPTDRTLGFSGASSMNQFYNNLWSGEGYAGLSEVTDAEVPRQVWKFLKENKFDDIHAAGIMGNFYQESKFNPNMIESNGEGIGLGQWSFGRKAALKSYALRITGSDEGWRNNVNLQLQFMILADEVNTVRNYLNKNFSSVAEAAYWWGRYWERFNLSDGSMNAVRIPAAVQYYEMYAGKTSFENDDNSSSENNTENTGNNSTANTVKKYSHTPNIDDDGNADGVYKNNMQYQDSVKIDNAKSIKVEVWYSTEAGYDWLNIRGQEQGPLSNWDDGNKMYSGGNKLEKPNDDDETYHKIITLDGDTAFFAFKSDRSVGRYGYYAIVTADQMNADTSWLEEQNNATANMPNILVNANVCSGHNGHGCQSYSHFGYGDNSRLYLEYNGNRIETVYPAALDPAVSNGEVACSVPSGSWSDFYTAIDHNHDCWVGELRSTNTSSGSGLHTRGGSSYFDERTDYGYEVTSGNPHQFYVTITIDEWEEEDDDDDTETYHTNEYWVFTHHCNQQHTGYYCGGHLRMIIYGLIYHMTPAERANTHELYASKTDNLEYKKGYPSSHFGSEDALADKTLVKNAEDLFDIDMAIYHVNKSVSDEFPGWSYDYMDMAALKLDADWDELYGIKASWTINGINAGGNAGSTLLSSGDVTEILDNAREQYPHDGTDTIRDQAIQTAIQFVGKIGYSQAHHSDPLRVGGYSDCSGFVSQVYRDVLRQVYNTDGFESLAKRYKAYRNFTDGNCKPGDILLHGMDTPQHNDNHALLYTGIVNGTVQSIDCSTSGGVGSVFYRSRGAAYYNGCTYIDMTVFINGYLADHPELKGNVYPDNNTSENSGTPSDNTNKDNGTGNANPST